MGPASQEMQLRRAGVPLNTLYHDVGVSGTTGTQERRGCHRLNSHVAGGDTLVVVAIDRRRNACGVRIHLRNGGQPQIQIQNAPKLSLMPTLVCP